MFWDEQKRKAGTDRCDARRHVLHEVLGPHKHLIVAEVPFLSGLPTRLPTRLVRRGVFPEGAVLAPTESAYAELTRHDAQHPGAMTVLLEAVARVA